MSLQTLDEKHLLQKWSIAYLAMFLLMWYCMVNFKSGPCSPNLDVLSFLLVSVLNLVFLLASILQFIKEKSREALLPLLVHLIAFLILMVLGFT